MSALVSVNISLASPAWCARQTHNEKTGNPKTSHELRSSLEPLSQALRWSAGNKYKVRSRLRPGERVLSNGCFLWRRSQSGASGLCRQESGYPASSNAKKPKREGFEAKCSTQAGTTLTYYLYSGPTPGHLDASACDQFLSRIEKEDSPVNSVMVGEKSWSEIYRELYYAY